MKIKIWMPCLIASLLPTIVFAAIHPVMTLSLGSSRANVYASKIITLVPTFQNTYLSNSHYDTETVNGIFFGVETRLLKDWSWQMGLSYFQSSSYAAKGTVYQFSDPDYNNLAYEYQIQNRRVLMEAKLSRAFRKKWHPYVSAGVGRAYNKAYAYHETGMTSADEPMAQPFGSHSSKSLTYTAGLGIDVDINEHLRLGAGWRFANLGSAGLGATPLQSGSNTISHTPIHSNEFLLQLSCLA